MEGWKYCDSSNADIRGHDAGCVRECATANTITAQTPKPYKVPAIAADLVGGDARSAAQEENSEK